MERYELIWDSMCNDIIDLAKLDSQLPLVAMGRVGADDAFCSGVLYGAWKGLGMQEVIELGTACATCSLSQPGGTERVISAEETRKLYDRMR